MSFGTITQNKDTERKWNYVTWIQTVLTSTLKKKDIYVDIAKDVETRFNTSNYESERPLPRPKK